MDFNSGCFICRISMLKDSDQVTAKEIVRSESETGVSKQDLIDLAVSLPVLHPKIAFLFACAF